VTGGELLVAARCQQQRGGLIQLARLLPLMPGVVEGGAVDVLGVRRQRTSH